jgi:hypothetical protein
MKFYRLKENCEIAGGPVPQQPWGPMNPGIVELLKSQFKEMVLDGVLWIVRLSTNTCTSAISLRFRGTTGNPCEIRFGTELYSGVS